MAKQVFIFESAFAIGDEVVIKFFKTQGSAPCGTVVGVGFTESKVTYDVNLELGGETLRNVDSCFVEAP